jgi:hypothetical protein
VIAISVHADIAPVLRRLDALRRQQLPFALARALTDSAHDAQLNMAQRLPDIFDRPTPFTMRAIGVQPARKGPNPRARVFVKDIQARYLRTEELGGARVPRQGQAFVLPGHVRLNRYGNMPPGLMKRLHLMAVQSKGTHDAGVAYLSAGVPGNKAGKSGYFRRRVGHRLQRLSVFRAIARYRARVHFRVRVKQAARRTIVGHLRKRLEQAIADAR